MIIKLPARITESGMITMGNKILIVFTLFLYAATVYTQTATDLPMMAANPERTSHNSVELRSNLSIDWHRVIDTFIDTKVQVIASARKNFGLHSKGIICI